jgi:hypothetical protein
MTSKMDLNGRTIRYTRFTTIGNALSWIHRAKNEAIVLGEIDEDTGDGEVMVMRLSDAARCDRAGYTVIYL